MTHVFIMLLLLFLSSLAILFGVWSKNKDNKKNEKILKDIDNLEIKNKLESIEAKPIRFYGRRKNRQKVHALFDKQEKDIKKAQERIAKLERKYNKTDQLWQVVIS